jgi:hypothetical protein
MHNFSGCKKEKASGSVSVSLVVPSAEHSITNKKLVYHYAMWISPSISLKVLRAAPLPSVAIDLYI